MIAVNVRYMVDDVDAAVAFYTTRLSFTLLTKTTHAFADVAMAPRTMSGTPIGLDAPQCASVEAGAPPLLSTGGGRGAEASSRADDRDLNSWGPPASGLH
jgi:catechol 2,3-dioxygenase-like lactoylglutathione lyase family enzyme